MREMLILWQGGEGDDGVQTRDETRNVCGRRVCLAEVDEMKGVWGT